MLAGVLIYRVKENEGKERKWKDVNKLLLLLLLSNWKESKIRWKKKDEN